jgi:carboxylesterase
MNIDELLDQARHDGVTDEDNLPFLLEPEGRAEAAVLLVHGFTASPWEMRSAAASLQQAGFTCLAIRLPGHGTTAEDLRQKTLEMWQAETCRGVRLLKQHFPRVYGMGMSSGGLLLLEPAARGDLQGIALLSPYLNLGHWLAPWTGLLRHFIRFQRREIATAAKRYYYADRPIAGIYQLCRVIRKAKQWLPKIHIPAIVMSAQGDQTISPKSAWTLYRLLGSKAKSFHQYGADVPHVLTTVDNPHLEDTLARISGFFTGLESGYKANSPTP